jgi:hypothetical protein
MDVLSNVTSAVEGLADSFAWRRGKSDDRFNHDRTAHQAGQFRKPS